MKNYKELTRVEFADFFRNYVSILGFSITPQTGKPSSLFNFYQVSNFIYKVVGNNLTDNEINAINEINTSNKIGDRVRAIFEKEASLEYCGIEGQVFENNLVLIDSCLPKILAGLIVSFNKDSKSNLLELVSILENENPLNYNTTNGHKFYEYKIKQLLTACALGMQSTTVWTGQLDATGGYLIVKEDGEILCYHIYNRNEFEDYLLVNTRLINPSSTRNKFALLYKENGALYFKLNFQIRFLK